MKIDGIDIEDLKTIEFNYDNIGVLKCIRHLIGVVINDVEYMDDSIKGMLEKQYLDLGNNNIIKRDDLESLYSMLDKINDIIEYNKEV